MALIRKDFNPDQPRAPQGSSIGGRWIRIGSLVESAISSLENADPAESPRPVGGEAADTLEEVQGMAEDLGVDGETVDRIYDARQQLRSNFEEGTLTHGDLSDALGQVQEVRERLKPPQTHLEPEHREGHAHDREEAMRSGDPFFRYVDGVTSGTTAVLPNGTMIQRVPHGDGDWDAFTIWGPDGPHSIPSTRYREAMKLLHEAEEALRDNPDGRERVAADNRQDIETAAHQAGPSFSVELPPGGIGFQPGQKDPRSLSDDEVRTLYQEAKAIFANTPLRPYGVAGPIRQEHERRFGNPTKGIPSRRGRPIHRPVPREERLMAGGIDRELARDVDRRAFDRISDEDLQSAIDAVDIASVNSDHPAIRRSVDRLGTELREERGRRGLEGALNETGNPALIRLAGDSKRERIGRELEALQPGQRREIAGVEVRQRTGQYGFIVGGRKRLHRDDATAAVLHEADINQQKDSLWQLSMHELRELAEKYGIGGVGEKNRQRLMHLILDAREAAVTKAGFDPKKHPRWPKGTPGIGGQFRPDGMPDSAASIAVKVLDLLSKKDPQQSRAAERFQRRVQRIDWPSVHDPDERVRSELRLIMRPVLTEYPKGALPTVEKFEGTRPYFAYGANMNASTMKVRAPGVIDRGKATLPGHRLEFRGGVTNVGERDGREVAGALFDVTQGQLEALDGREGWPRTYNRKRVKVLDQDGHEVQAYVYFMDDEQKRSRGNWPPKTDYVRTLEEALEGRGQPIDDVETAIQEDQARGPTRGAAMRRGVRRMATNTLEEFALGSTTPGVTRQAEWELDVRREHQWTITRSQRELQELTATIPRQIQEIREAMQKLMAMERPDPNDPKVQALVGLLQHYQQKGLTLRRLEAQLQAVRRELAIRRAASRMANDPAQIENALHGPHPTRADAARRILSSRGVRSGRQPRGKIKEMAAKTQKGLSRNSGRPLR